MPAIDEDNPRGSNGYYWGDLKDVIITRLEFRPRTQYAHLKEWSRNQYSIVGTTYFVYLQ